LITAGKRVAILARLWVAQRYRFLRRRSISDRSSSRIPPQYQILVEDEPAEAAVEVLPRGLEAFNESQWPDHAPWRPLGVFIRDAEIIMGGLAGETYCGWLCIRYLWVRDDLRSRGFGRELMARAETRAVERGCHSAWLDTFSFQARGFYEKLGYEEFGTLDYPPNHKRHFMKKRLTSEL
jgi:GNAT superfamily N-acetyltransferase